MLILFIPYNTDKAFKAWLWLPVLYLPVIIFKLAELEHDLFGPVLQVVII